MIENFRENPSHSRSYKKLYFSGLISGIFLSSLILFHGPQVREYCLSLGYSATKRVLKEQPNFTGHEAQSSIKYGKIQDLKNRYHKLTPRNSYLIINTADNLIYLMKNQELIHKGPCSSGSYVHLKASHNREWLFKTPRGSFKVEMKLKAPVWYMPDWAFLEEGREIPPSGSVERYNTGALGEFAISIGRGYLIHGTIYKRLIGKPVTHGCIRLDDDELRAVYRHLKYGARVYIY